MLKFLGSNKYPKGPKLEIVKEHFLDLSGTRIYFKTPPHTDSDVPFKVKPEKYNIYDKSIFWSYPDLTESAMEMEGGYTENWVYYGLPIFKSIGRLGFGIGVIRNLDFGSLLSPVNFINAINQNINYSAGPLSRLSKGYYSKVRNNWSIQILDRAQFVHYEFHKSHCLHSNGYWVAPISDDHYIYLTFSKLINHEKTNLHQTYDELIENVLSSVRIEWSPDALRQQAEAKQKWPNQSLPGSLPELTWTDEEWRAGETDDQRERREFQEQFEELNSRKR